MNYKRGVLAYDFHICQTHKILMREIKKLYCAHNLHVHNTMNTAPFVRLAMMGHGFAALSLLMK
jgi:hypothetical protein